MKTTAAFGFGKLQQDLLLMQLDRKFSTINPKQFWFALIYPKASRFITAKNGLNRSMNIAILKSSST